MGVATAAERRSERPWELGLLGGLIAVAAFLAWVAVTNTVETYDGYEYLLDGRVLWGDSAYWKNKNALWMALLALVHGPFHLAGARPSLVPFHLASLAVTFGYAAVASRWLARVVPGITVAVAAALALGNRLVLHYASFELPDVMCALTVAGWLHAEVAARKESRWAWLRRAAWLAAMALGRPNTLVIPAVAMLVWGVRDRRRMRLDLLAAGAGAALALVAFAIVQMLAHRLGPAASVTAGLGELAAYALNTATQQGQPGWVYASYLGLLLTPVGLAAAVVGLVVFIREARRHRGGAPAPTESPAEGTAWLGHRAGLVLGSLAYVLVMSRVGQKEARYLAQALPAVLVLQGVAARWLARRWRPGACALALAVLLAASPEAVRFADPFYRADIARLTAARIVEWAGDRAHAPIFATPMATLHPRERLFHWNDHYFYLFHWGRGAFEFHTGVATTELAARVTFSRHGYPVPDAIERLAAPGQPIVVASDAGDEHVTNRPRMGHVIALRWRPRGGDDRACLPSVPAPCVEALIAFDGQQP